MDEWDDVEEYFDDGDETGDDDPGFWLEDQAQLPFSEGSEG